jgi:hypothetical protein
MTIKQFNKLTVNSLVRISVKGRNVPTAWGCAYRINRTTKSIKPFGSKRWYSYKQVSIDSEKYHPYNIWGLGSPTFMVEMQATEYEISKM